jgi:hypothetical protein
LTLAAEGATSEAGDLLRSLIGVVVITPYGANMRLDLRGEPSGIVEFSRARLAAWDAVREAASVLAI